MFGNINPATAQKLDEKFCPALKNPAVALCSQAWSTTVNLTLERTKSVYTAKRLAGSMYRMAMPPLTGYQNICDFIACTGFGILCGAIKPDHGTKLLYAAQVALAALPKEAKIQTPATTDASKHPTPPPILLQQQQTKRIKSKKTAVTPQKHEFAAIAADENPEQPFSPETPFLP